MKTCCGYSLEAPQCNASYMYPQQMLSSRSKKYISISGWKTTAFSGAKIWADGQIKKYQECKQWTFRLVCASSVLSKSTLHYPPNAFYKCPGVSTNAMAQTSMHIHTVWSASSLTWHKAHFLGCRPMCVCVCVFFFFLTYYKLAMVNTNCKHTCSCLVFI